MTSFRINYASYLGSSALDATLAGRDIGSSLLLVSGDDWLVDALCLNYIKSRQNERNQTIVVELERSFYENHIDNSVCDLKPQSDGSGVTFIRCSQSKEPLPSLEALLCLDSFSSVLILTNCHLSNIAKIDELSCAAKQKGVGCVVFSSQKCSALGQPFDATIIVEGSSELKVDDGSLFGWRIDGVSIQSDNFSTQNRFATLINPDLSIYSPFDLVVAGLISGVLEESDNGQITSKGRAFTDSFDEAVQKLVRLDVQARLKSAIIFAQNEI